MGALLKIASHDNGQRLDAVLAKTYPQYSRSFFQKFMKKGGVTLSGSVREPDYRVHVGETFKVADFEAFIVQTEASTRPDSGVGAVPKILHEDAALLVIDKPANLVVHPAPGHRVGTLTDWLKGHLGSKIAKVFTNPERLGLVHRLDKDTSGVLVIAKSILAQTAISRQFHDRTVKKTYVAFVEGIPSSKSGIINAPVGRDRRTPTRMAVSTLGRTAETAFEVNETMKEVSLVTVHPKTGRTHQIRVHLAAIGHPIVGDRTYGAKSLWHQAYGIQRPLLHAERLELKHPTTGKSVTYHAPWPDDFHAAQRCFRAAFKILVVLAAVGVWSARSARADDDATPKPATHTAASHSTSSSKGSSSSDIRKLKRELAEIKENLAAVKESLANVKDAMDQLNAGDRLRDLEHAASELNGKAVGTAAGAEETKTQILEMSRRLKSQQDTLEQLRDQLDRLQSQSIKRQNGTAPAPEPAPAEGSK